MAIRESMTGLGAVFALVVATSAWAQAAPGSRTHNLAAPGLPTANGTGLYWSDADQQKALPPGPGMKVLAWTPNWRLALRRVAVGKGTPEMHEDKTQIYVVLAGAGTQVMGGAPKTVKDVGEGNHVTDGPLEGAATYHLKAGDVVVIPPLTWHQIESDPDQPITYRMIDVPSPTRMP